VLSAGGTILVADDERHLREGLAELLSADGHTVLQATDGTGVMNLLRDRVPDTIFLDPEAGRHRNAQSTQTESRASADSCGNHHGLRRQRANHGGHEGRRLRLHHQTVRSRRGAAARMCVKRCEPLLLDCWIARD